MTAANEIHELRVQVSARRRDELSVSLMLRRRRRRCGRLTTALLIHYLC